MLTEETMDETAHKTLLMLGDSLAEWGDWPALLPELAVINRGRAGELTEELSARLFFELDQLPEPDCILLVSGTNNMLQGNIYFPAVFQTMLPRLAALCPQSLIAVNSLMPMRLPELAQESITAVNRELRQAAEAHGCRFLDMTGPFHEHCLPVTKPCFLNDGVHLSTLGYQVWAREISKVVRSSPL